jgi:hypothetical protein
VVGGQSSAIKIKIKEILIFLGLTDGLAEFVLLAQAVTEKIRDPAA